MPREYLVNLRIMIQMNPITKSINITNATSPQYSYKKKKGNVKYPQHEIDKWIERERQDGNDEVIAYTDAGYENKNGRSNGPYLAVDQYGYIEDRGIKLTKLEITS